jgi:hypothetical protein
MSQRFVAERRTLLIVGVLLLIMGSLHLMRAALHIEIVCAGWAMPLWFSIAVGVALLALSSWMIKIARR